MRLTDDFYRIKQKSVLENGFECTLSLNRAHFIYQAHFPGNPVTPGVCIIQFCKELMALHTGKELFLKKISNVKFLSVINPEEYDTVQVRFSKILPENDGYKCTALVYRDTIQFVKLGFYLQCLIPNS